eukprot:jgi/Tetstr1/430876/TSEL_020633.t1
MRSAADLQAIPHYSDFPLHSVRKVQESLSHRIHTVCFAKLDARMPIRGPDSTASGAASYALRQILTDPSVLVSLPKGSAGRPADVGLFGYGGIRGNTVAVDTTIASILAVSSSDPTTALRAAERHNKIQKYDEGVRNAAGKLRFLPFAVSEFGPLAPHAEAFLEQVDTSRRLGAVEVAQLLTCSRVVEALEDELELQLLVLALALAQQELDDLSGATGAVLRRWSTTARALLKAAAGKVRISGLLKRASNQQGAARLASIIGAAHASATNASPLAANKFKQSVSKRRGDAALQPPTAAWAAPEGTSEPASGAEGASSSDTTVQAAAPQPSPHK